MKRVSINGKKQTKAMLFMLINEKTKFFKPIYYSLSYADVLSICRQVGIEYDE